MGRDRRRSRQGGEPPTFPRIPSPPLPAPSAAFPARTAPTRLARHGGRDAPGADIGTLPETRHSESRIHLWRKGQRTPQFGHHNRSWMRVGTVARPASLHAASSVTFSNFPRLDRAIDCTWSSVEPFNQLDQVPQCHYVGSQLSFPSLLTDHGATPMKSPKAIGVRPTAITAMTRSFAVEITVTRSFVLLGT